MCWPIAKECHHNQPIRLECHHNTGFRGCVCLVWLPGWVCHALWQKLQSQQEDVDKCKWKWKKPHSDKTRAFSRVVISAFSSSFQERCRKGKTISLRFNSPQKKPLLLLCIGETLRLLRRCSSDYNCGTLGLALTSKQSFCVSRTLVAFDWCFPKTIVACH